MFSYKVTFTHIEYGEVTETVNSWVKAADVVRELLFSGKRGATITIEVS